MFSRKPVAVLFDLDGTLVDNAHIVVQCYVNALDSIGLQPNREDISLCKGLRYR